MAILFSRTYDVDSAVRSKYRGRSSMWRGFITRLVAGNQTTPPPPPQWASAPDSECVGDPASTGDHSKYNHILLVRNV